MDQNISNEERSEDSFVETSIHNVVENTIIISNGNVLNKRDFNDLMKSNSTQALKENNIRDLKLSSSLQLISSDGSRNKNIEPRLVRNTGLHITSNLPASISENMISLNHPEPLFLLALSKVQENSLSCSVTNVMKQNFLMKCMSERQVIKTPNSEIRTPDSVMSAPPSYSFVLRQMARRRPRLMGTFIPSPSFVNHTPPPNYATAFDIYIDNPIPPPARVYNFGYMPMLIVCPECGYIGMTNITSKITASTHLCAIVLCLFCCWICAPLPYLLRSCKKVYHYCRNCRTFVGMYCPTHPDNQHRG